MITLYRFLPNENEILVNIQGDEDDVKALEAIINTRVYLTKRASSYEQEHYCYIRGSSRAENEQKVVDYLQTNYTPPPVELLLFKGKNACPDDRPASYWPAVLAGQIQQFFAQKQQRMIGPGRLGYEVFLAEPLETAPGLHLYEGITYRISVQPDFIPIVQTDITFRYVLDGETVSRTKVLHRFSGQADILVAVHEQETKTTDDIFELSQRFVRSLDFIGEQFKFNEQPLTTEELGWQTWLWAHENPLTLEVSEGEQIHVATEMLLSDLGLYHPPDPFQLISIYPEDTDKPRVPAINGRDFVSQVRKVLRETLPGRQVPIDYAGFALGEANEATVEQCKQLNDQHPERKTLYLMIAPPRESRQAHDPDLAAMDTQSFKLMRAVRKLGTMNYLVTLNWDKLLDDYDRTFIIESAVLKGLVVLGATPWRVQNIPFANGNIADNVCFIGLDVKADREPAIVGGAIIDGYGVLRGYHVARLKDSQGDLIDNAALSQIVERLLDHFCQATNREPAHVIVHRDGLYHGEETAHLQYLLAELGMTYDLVEIRKSGAPRLRQGGNLFGTPSKDIAVGSEIKNVAYLSNTLSVGQNVSGHWIFPATESIGVHRKIGNSPIKVLAAQVHALSRAHISAIRRTERLPVSTAYADALVSNVGFRSRQGSHFGKAIGQDAQPYWL